MKNFWKITLLISLFLPSCRWFMESSTSYSIGAGFKVPPGSPTFQRGYRDGCSQIFYSRGNMFYRWRHGYNYDPKLNRNAEYRFGYKRGISFCFNFIVSGVTSPDRMIFPDKTLGASMAAMSYNETGLFGGVEAVPVPSIGGGFNDMFGVWAGSSTTSALGANPLWAGGSKGQFFGQ